MEWWFILALFSAFFAALAAIFAKVGLQEVDSNVATAMRSIIMTLFIIAFIAAIGKLTQLTQITHSDMIFIILSGITEAASWLCYFAALG
jgi:transporter family protein